MTSITHRRLVKKAAGVVTALWEDAGTYNVGQSYGLVVEAFSDLVAYFDTVPPFSVLDGDLRAGRAGFYCWANKDARFARVQVSAGNGSDFVAPAAVRCSAGRATSPRRL